MITTMTSAERRTATLRVDTFRRANPGFLESLPAVILGAGDREVCLLDATHADFQNYTAFLKRRIDRRERLIGVAAQ